MADSKPINVEEARKVLRRLNALLDSVGFTAPEILPQLKHRAAVEIDRLAEALGLVPREVVGKGK